MRRRALAFFAWCLARCAEPQRIGFPLGGSVQSTFCSSPTPRTATAPPFRKTVEPTRRTHHAFDVYPETLDRWSPMRRNFGMYVRPIERPFEPTKGKA